VPHHALSALLEQSHFQEVQAALHAPLEPINKVIPASNALPENFRIYLLPHRALFALLEQSHL
jgi:hypothetical protein